MFDIINPRNTGRRATVALVALFVLCVGQSACGPRRQGEAAPPAQRAAAPTEKPAAAPPSATPPRDRNAIVPGVAQEIDGVRVGWLQDDLKTAVKAAQADGKPVVALFIEDNCGWCQVFVTNDLRCPTFNTLAGQAHFVIANPARDSDSNSLGSSLGVTSYPTISVFRLKGSHLSELVRLVGNQSERELVDDLKTADLATSVPKSLNPDSVALGGYIPQGCIPANPPDGVNSGGVMVLPDEQSPAGAPA